MPVVPSGSTLEQELAEVLFVLKETQSLVVLTTERTMKSFFKDHLQCTGSPPPSDLDWWKTNEFGSYHPSSKKQDNAYDFMPKLDKNRLPISNLVKIPSVNLKELLLPMKTS